MENVSEHSFIINLDEEDPYVKPLPPQINRRRGKAERLKLLEEYPAHNEEFYQLVAETAQKIEGLYNKETKKKFNRDLTIIFAKRDFTAIHRLYLQVTYMLLGDKNGHYKTY